MIKISLKPTPKGPINNIPALVQIMAWRQPGEWRQAIIWTNVNPVHQHKNFLIHYIRFSHAFVMKFYTEFSSVTAALGAKFQSD